MLQKITVLIFVISLFLIPVKNLHSTDYKHKIIELENISRFNEDRLVYQHIEIDFNEDIPALRDNSLATLLIIRDKKMYLFKDGYDEIKEVMTQKTILEHENRLIPDLWINKIQNSPNYVRITDRKTELQKNTSKEFVSTNYKDFYLKVRDDFLTIQVNIFKALMINRKDSGLTVERHPIPKKIRDTGPTKFFVSVTGKTLDEKVYYAEDGDGDGITETFFVTIPDGFNWGYESGPNIVCVYKNKQKEIQNIIGKLTDNAQFGTAEESEIIKKTFPKSDTIAEMMKLIYKLDADTRKSLDEKGIKY